MKNFRELVNTTWHRLELATTPSQLALKLQALQKEIRHWYRVTLGDIETQALTCNQTLMWIIRAEEIRSLTQLEKFLRTTLTEQLLKLDNIKETKWRQRAKRQWVKEGDKNTKFFHAVATQQKRINAISSLQLQGTEVTQHSIKARALFEYYCNLIGTHQATEVNFDLQNIYGQQQVTQEEVQMLTQPWTEMEIAHAVGSWKGNRSPGPDGFTGEFYNAFLHTLLPDLKEVFLYVNCQPDCSLHPLNNSHIILVPKKEPALLPTDFRPISLINGVQKIYSKVMAARLTPLLHIFLSSSQTGFLKGRSILHGFHYAQQVIQSATKQQAHIAILKADIFKAFDTLDWHFLLQSLRARGFPHSWLQCIKNNVLQGSSKIVLNSVASREIRLRRGVRQGDPLSPYLFNLAIDLLPRWIKKLNEMNFLAPPFLQCRTCLLYADDTLIFTKQTANQLLKVKFLFDVFGKASGLAINLAKSELMVTSSNATVLHTLANIMQCRPQTFPTKYLGLLLSDKSLTRSDYLPLIDRTQAVLSGWKAPLLSVGGRFVLTNAVITAIPQYFMSTFLLPK